MFEAGDTVKIITNGVRLISQGVEAEFANTIGTIEVVESQNSIGVRLAPDIRRWFSASDLQLVTTDAVKVLKDRYETKDTNPKDAVGIKKVPTWFIPTCPQMELGLAMMEGARKYGAFNWRVDGVRGSVYYDAAMRHLNAWKEGQDTDPDSGLPHLMKAAACLFILRDSIIMQNWTDDRPPTYPQRSLPMNYLNGAAGKIIEKYPDCKEPFTELNREG